MSKSHTGPSRPKRTAPHHIQDEHPQQALERPHNPDVAPDPGSQGALPHPPPGPDGPGPGRAGGGGHRHHGRDQGRREFQPGRLRVLHLSAGGTSSGATTAADPGTTKLSPQVLAALTVPSATLDAVGSPSSVVLPTKTGDGTIAKGSDGKPLITYIGAEYCPFCAAERWSLAVALSRFGTFENLSGTHSSDSDEFPDTQTLSFYGSTYSSPYVDFEAVEEATNQPDGNSYQALQSPTAAQTALMAKYDTQGSIPFLDIANRYVITGSSFSPQVLQGLSRSQIAADLSNPDSAVAQAIDGAANDITAAIASVTGNQPSSVGSSATIAAIAQKLGA